MALPVAWMLIFVGTLLLGMLVMLELGRRLRLRRQSRSAGDAPGFGAVEGAVFALLGLLIAFTFSGAASRFDARRQLIIDEANDIGTAYLRIDLLPEDAQPVLREKFRRYVDLRISAYRSIGAPAEVAREQERTVLLQNEIWRDAVDASRRASTTQAMMLVLPAINSMIDIAATRSHILGMHPPFVIFLLLAGITLASSLFAGYGMAAIPDRSWLHVLGFCSILSLSVYVILDLEYPRFGLIRVDDFDRVLLAVRDGMR
jgi:hypothetical protein